MAAGPNDEPPANEGAPRGRHDPDTGITLRATLRGHAGRIRRIAWSPDGTLLASPAADQTARIWEFPSGALIKKLGFARNV